MAGRRDRLPGVLGSGHGRRADDLILMRRVERLDHLARLDFLPADHQGVIHTKLRSDFGQRGLHGLAGLGLSEVGWRLVAEAGDNGLRDELDR